MDIFMQGISYAASSDLLTQTFASIFHSQAYAHFSDGGLLLNFQVNLFPDKKRRTQAHSGSGILTLPLREVALRFLKDYGGNAPIQYLALCGRRIKFQQSIKPLRTDLVEYCRRMPYQDPQAKAEYDHKMAQLSDAINVHSVQFGWECRDQVFSLEWERTYDSSLLCFDDENRRIRVTGYQGNVASLDHAGDPAEHYVVRYAHISYLAISGSDNSVYLTLHVPPAFERDIRRDEDERKFLEYRSWLLNPNPAFKPQACLRRVSHFGGDHARLAPFVSLAMRLKMSSYDAVGRFRHMANVAGLPVHDFTMPIERRGIFSEQILGELAEWLKSLPWMVAFHLEVLHRKLLLDPHELLELRRDVDRFCRFKGRHYTAQLMRHFAGGRRSSCSVRANFLLILPYLEVLRKIWGKSISSSCTGTDMKASLTSPSIDTTLLRISDRSL
jgi:RNA-dependent RNA polymerase